MNDDYGGDENGGGGNGGRNENSFLISTFPFSLCPSFPSHAPWGLSDDVDDNGGDEDYVDNVDDEFLPPSSSAWRSFRCKLFMHFIQILASESAHEILSPQIFLWNIELCIFLLNANDTSASMHYGIRAVI